MKYEEHEEYKIALEILVMFSKKYLNMLSKIDSQTYEEVKEAPDSAEKILKHLIEENKTKNLLRKAKVK